MAQMRIDDFGGYPRDSDEMMNSRVKLKKFKSAEGEGHISDYPDTTEEVYRDQEKGAGKISKHQQKPGYRN